MELSAPFFLLPNSSATPLTNKHAAREGAHSSKSKRMRNSQLSPNATIYQDSMALKLAISPKKVTQAVRGEQKITILNPRELELMANNTFIACNASRTQPNKTKLSKTVMLNVRSPNAAKKHIMAGLSFIQNESTGRQRQSQGIHSRGLRNAALNRTVIFRTDAENEHRVKEQSFFQQSLNRRSVRPGQTFYNLDGALVAMTSQNEKQIVDEKTLPSVSSTINNCEIQNASKRKSAKSAHRQVGGQIRPHPNLFMMNDNNIGLQIMKQIEEPQDGSFLQEQYAIQSPLRLSQRNNQEDIQIQQQFRHLIPVTSTPDQLVNESAFESNHQQQQKILASNQANTKSLPQLNGNTQQTASQKSISTILSKRKFIRPNELNNLQKRGQRPVTQGASNRGADAPILIVSLNQQRAQEIQSGSNDRQESLIIRRSQLTEKPSVEHKQFYPKHKELRRSIITQSHRFQHIQHQGAMLSNPDSSLLLDESDLSIFHTNKRQSIPKAQQKTSSAKQQPKQQESTSSQKKSQSRFTAFTTLPEQESRSRQEQQPNQDIIRQRFQQNIQFFNNFPLSKILQQQNAQSMSTVLSGPLTQDGGVRKVAYRKLTRPSGDRSSNRQSLNNSVVKAPEPKVYNQNMLSLAFKENKRVLEERRKKNSSEIGTIRKDLVDKATKTTRPQTEFDIGNENNQPSNGEQDNFPLNRVAIGALIKEMLQQRNALQKEHLRKIDKKLKQQQHNDSNSHHNLYFNTQSPQNKLFQGMSSGRHVQQSQPTILSNNISQIVFQQNEASTNQTSGLLILDKNLSNSQFMSADNAEVPELAIVDSGTYVLNDHLNKLREHKLSDDECHKLLSVMNSFKAEEDQEGPVFENIEEIIDQINNERVNSAKHSEMQPNTDILKKRYTSRIMKNTRLQVLKKTTEQIQNSQKHKTDFKLTEEQQKNKHIYPPTTIDIIHIMNEDIYSYKSHPINKSINRINSFIFLAFKSKDSQSMSSQLDYLKPEFKKYNIPVPPKNTPMTATFIRTREVLAQAKYQLMNALCTAINISNGNFDPKKFEIPQQLKFFIGRGNNSHMVKAILRQRLMGNWTQKDRAPHNSNSHVDNVAILEETTLEDVNFIWTQVKRQHIANTFKTLQSHNESKQKTGNTKFVQFLKQLAKDPTSKPPIVDIAPIQAAPLQLRLYGKLENNFHLSNKKALFMNMKLYYEALNQDPFDVLPLTFHIKTGLDDPEYQDFKKTFEEYGKNLASFKNVWIIKPGENTNRGTGIQVCNTLKEIEAIIRESSGCMLGYSTFIVQKYIEKPLLIKKRKFDIRCYGLFTSINGVQKGFFYNDGYIRTSSKEYNTNNLSNKFVHLTNDAIQKCSDDYGRYENGNKMSFKEFQKYLDQHHASQNVEFNRDLWPQIKKLIQDTFRAVYGKLDPQKRLHGFEVFGYDFMIDEDFRIYLIEVNTNPCLETTCPLLARIISEMLDNTFKVAFDPLFFSTLNQGGQLALPDYQAKPLPQTPLNGNTSSSSVYPKKQTQATQSDVSITIIKYELVFDENIEGDFLKEKVLCKTMQETIENIGEDEDEMAEVQEEGDQQPQKILMQIDEKDEDDDRVGSSIQFVRLNEQ